MHYSFVHCYVSLHDLKINKKKKKQIVDVRKARNIEAFKCENKLDAENHPPPLPQTLPPAPRRTLQFDHLHHHQHHDGGGEEWQQHRHRIISSSNNNNRPLSHGSWTDTTTPTAQFYSASEYGQSTICWEYSA